MSFIRNDLALIQDHMVNNRLPKDNGLSLSKLRLSEAALENPGGTAMRLGKAAAGAQRENQAPEKNLGTREPGQPSNYTMDETRRAIRGAERNRRFKTRRNGHLGPANAMACTPRLP